MEEILKIAHKWIDEYIKTFYTGDKDIEFGIHLKEIHTGYVTANARQLAQHLQLNQHDVLIAELMGLLHDVGRFRQWTLYQTFVDSKSEDHADLGLKVIVELPFYGMLTQEDQSLLLFAVQNHNKKDIAPAPDKRHLLFAKILRDADKIDIYRVLEPFLEPSDGQGFAPGFVERFTKGQQVDFNLMETKDDRKLVRLMWVYDVNFAWSLQKICEANYAEKIIANLPTDPEFMVGVNRLRKYIADKCAQSDLPLAL